MTRADGEVRAAAGSIPRPSKVRMHTRHLIPLAAYAMAIVLALFGTLWFGSFSAGFNEPDEPSHFLNALFVRDYFRDGFGTHPMRFATEYYLHYPKLAIGHWPPAYYGLVGFLFFIVPASAKTALILNAIVSTSPVIVIAAVINRFFGATTALLASLWYISLPAVIWSLQYFLLDQAVAAAVLAACAAWLWFAFRPTLPRALLVAVLCSFAVLTKGNGWLVALFPLCHIALTGRWNLLKDKRTYLCLILALLLVVPWYILTVGIAADGFNYKPGFAYAQLALVNNVRFIAQNLGYAGMILATVGVSASWNNRTSKPERWECAAACLALVFATLIFQSIVPASLEERYIAPALPALLILAVMGISACLAWIGRFRAQLLRVAATAVLILAAIYPALLSVSESHA
ncbi:MAG TPA: glycosyltransferase family 39 protein, partial [Burkholderiales bacterium]|nr:glycosyltransferase family 39 protein [Burkholderiales bacterium]